MAAIAAELLKREPAMLTCMPLLPQRRHSNKELLVANPKRAPNTPVTLPQTRAGSDAAGGAAPQARVKPARSISVDHPDYLDRYLDQLLNEALEETFPASDALAVPTKHDVQKR
jgi:hypothetical protein